MKKKKTMLIYGGIFILFMGIVMFTLIGVLNKNDNPESGGGLMSLIGIESNGSVNQDNDIKDVEKLFPMDMTEVQIQNGIHHMSHQKIIADKKWGSLELTEERVNRLLAVAQKNQSQLEFGETYIEILTRWSNKDFSRIVEDHNYIWRLQNGSLGKAVREATEKEEQAYIAEYFR